jgi:hypothetical protein
MRIFLGILACYRLARLFSQEDGPFDTFDWMREEAGCYTYGADGRPATSLGRLLECPFCLGIWFALFCTLLVWKRTGFSDAMLLWLGIAGGQTFLQERGVSDAANRPDVTGDRNHQIDD